MGKPLKKLGSFLKNNGLDLLGGVLSKNPVGAVLDIVTKELGISSDKGRVMDEGELITLIEKDPDAFVKLKEAELTYEVELRKLDIQSDAMYLSDVQSARDREKSVVASTKKKDWFLYGLASLIVIGFFGYGVSMMLIEIPANNIKGIDMVTGGLITSFALVVGYFFGSSAGSSEKTKIIANGNAS